MNFSEAAKFLGYAESTFYNMVERKKVPHYRPNKKMYFKKKELIEWIKKGKLKFHKKQVMKTKDKKIKAGLTMEIDIKNLASLVLQEIKRHEEEEFFNFREAAKFLDYNEKYFYRAIKKKKIPHYRPEDKLYFKKKELIEWIKKGKVKLL